MFSPSSSSEYTYLINQKKELEFEKLQAAMMILPMAFSLSCCAFFVAAKFFEHDLIQAALIKQSSYTSARAENLQSNDFESDGSSVFLKEEVEVCITAKRRLEIGYPYRVDVKTSEVS